MSKFIKINCLLKRLAPAALTGTGPAPHTGFGSGVPAQVSPLRCPPQVSPSSPASPSPPSHQHPQAAGSGAPGPAPSPSATPQHRAGTGLGPSAPGVPHTGRVGRGFGGSLSLARCPGREDGARESLFPRQVSLSGRDWAARGRRSRGVSPRWGEASLGHGTGQGRGTQGSFPREVRKVSGVGRAALTPAVSRRARVARGGVRRWSPAKGNPGFYGFCLTRTAPKPEGSSPTRCQPGWLSSRRRSGVCCD